MTKITEPTKTNYFVALNSLEFVKHILGNERDVSHKYYVSLRKHINILDVELIDIFPFINDVIWNILETFGCLIIEK